MTQVRFNVLGPIELRIDGKIARLRGVKNRVVLSCLALRPETVVSMDDLVRAAWPDERPPSAEHQVRKIISQLRLSIPRRWDVLATVGGGYLLCAGPERSDVQEFRALLTRVHDPHGVEEAELPKLLGGLQLWRGAPAKGLTPSGFEKDVQVLEEEYRVFLQRCVDIFARYGRAAELAPHLRSMAYEFPGDRTIADHLAVALGGHHERTSASEQTTRQEILGRLPEPRGHANANGHKAIISMLPRDLPEYQGREAEVEAVTRALRVAEPDHLRLVTITGMAGIGKTELALHVAHALKHQFSHGAFFVDLHGFTPGRAPLQAHDAVAALLHQVGIAEHEMPSTFDGRVALWRLLTHDQRVLLVADNVATLDQVRPLLPNSSHSCVIVTGRLTLTGIDGASHIHLELPSERECVRLLGSFIGDHRVAEEPDSAAELVRQCGRLPLAIRLAAARVVAESSSGLGEIVQRFREADSPLAELEVPGRSLRGYLNVSIDALSDSDAEVFVLLARHPVGDFNAHSVATLAEIELASAQASCRRLADANLLIPQRPGWFGIHDLLREAGRSRATAEMAAERGKGATSRLELLGAGKRQWVRNPGSA
ncbi:MAG TPA: NB-ARC domain-containing protein [Jatrophihabitans sp.]|jgi:hypothetical protein|uniref:AfsR/SARP family transcriptional regulator n=1 Tax=Jatrophihabitans sp. TaxID=1932789 RepID=UPI002F1F2E16